MLLDIVKVLTFKHWSFELTALFWPSPTHRAKLEKRIKRKLVLDRVAVNMVKMRRVVGAIKAVGAFRKEGAKKSVSKVRRAV